MIQLPAQTTYWTYWIGVGQNANEQMKKFVGGLSAVATKVSFDPLVLLGLKLIPSLPVFNGTSTISYRFFDAQNAALFVRNQPSHVQNIKYSDNIASDFSTINTCPKDLVLATWNNSAFIGQNVNIRVVAFSVTMRLAMEE